MARSPATISAKAAIARAAWMVNYPVAAALVFPMIAAGAAAALWRPNAILLAISNGLLAGLLFGWLVWAALVPQWRLWAYQRVLDVAELKRLAVEANLIWPEGHFFEKTEIRSAALRRRLELLER